MGRHISEDASVSRSRIGHRFAALGVIPLLATMLIGAPSAIAADSVTLTTPYPAVAAAPGTKVSFTISVLTSSAGRVDLAVKGAPTDWTAQLFGGGFVVDGVESDGSKATDVRLDVTIPAAATATTSHLQVVATRANGSSDTLPLDIRVTPNAAGSVTLTTDVPQVKGPSTTTFSFSLTLHNDTAQDLNFGATASGPDGWTVTAQIGSTTNAASTLVKAGDTTTVAVSVSASSDVTAGQYPISVDATSGSQTAHADLSVEITGSFKLTLSTVDGRLSTSATAGSASSLSLVVTNTGTADIAGVTVKATAPNGWTATYDPADAFTVPAGQQVTVTAKMTPSADAIAGDYVVTYTASSPQSTATADIRTTVDTSLSWGLVGIGLIVLVLVGLYWTFQRYGRR
jgi:uncharacterized membrane protein